MGLTVLSIPTLSLGLSEGSYCACRSRSLTGGNSINRRDYKQWRRKMRKLNREARLKHNAEVAASAGTFNCDQNIRRPSYTSQLFILNNNQVCSRASLRGDFRTTTPYQIYTVSTKGKPLLYFRWYKKDPVKNRETTGLSAAYAEVSPAAWWGASASSMRTRLESASQAALVTKIVNDAPFWDVSTDLAESKEAIGLLASTATSMTRVISMVRNRDMSGLLKFLKRKNSRYNRRKLHRELYANTVGGQGVRTIDALSNLWMNYRNGFMPMIYSMQDAMISFNAEFAKGHQLTAQVTLGDSVFTTSRSTGNGTTMGTITGFVVETGGSYSVQGSWRKKAYFNYTDAMWARLIGNPIVAASKTAWELVKFSWVVDWFIGIGQYLSNLQVDTLVPTSSVNVTEKSHSVRRVWLSKASSSLFPQYRHTIDETIGTSAVSDAKFFARSKGSLSVPGIDLSQSWYTFKRSIDSACLGWQRVRRDLNTYVTPSGLRHRVH